MHGLNTYDYHARQQDFQTGRFTTVDPLAEKYYSWSPYHLAGNNPILNIDPFGMDYWSTNDPYEMMMFQLYGPYYKIDIFSWVNNGNDPEKVNGLLWYNDNTNIIGAQYADGSASYPKLRLTNPFRPYYPFDRPMPPTQNGSLDIVNIEFAILVPARAGIQLTTETAIGILGAMTRTQGTTNTVDASKSGFAFRNTEKMGRSKGNMSGNHKVQNKQIDSLVSKYKLTNDQRRELHDMISGHGYGYHEVEQIIKDFILK